MSRYRPPAPKSSPHITPAGQSELQRELKYLWKEKRPAVTKKVAEAAAQGDRSENADYIYGKRQLREIDRRIAYLSKRLDVLVVVDRAPPAVDKVFFGAWVTVEDGAGKEHCYRLVGADEFDAEPEYISIDSPMARALLGKSVDDEVVLQLGDSQQEFVVLDIAYQR